MNENEFVRAASISTRRDGLPTPSTEPSPSPRPAPATTGYRCIECSEVASGRFARRSGWTRGIGNLSWYCWTCLPYGRARRPVEPLDARPAGVPEPAEAR